MSKGSHSTLGIYAGRVCPGCGVVIRGKDQGGHWFQWTPERGHESWHFACHPSSVATPGKSWVKP